MLSKAIWNYWWLAKTGTTQSGWGTRACDSRPQKSLDRPCWRNTFSVSATDLPRTFSAFCTSWSCVEAQSQAADMFISLFVHCPFQLHASVSWSFFHDLRRDNGLEPNCANQSVLQCDYLFFQTVKRFQNVFFFFNCGPTTVSLCFAFQHRLQYTGPPSFTVFLWAGS